jgi:NADH-quinone oxidoreductase subunit L
MGFLGIIQNDIKRVVAYSTLSQLGYMTVALGASAYSVAIFHLMTHAFFKALLFLGAGSVIIGMHHDQDIRNMGGLRKYMPITWITSLIGSLALIGTPFLFRLLLQGLDHRGGACRTSRVPASPTLRHGRCLRHRLLLVPDVFPGLPRRGALRQGPRPSRHAAQRQTMTTPRTMHGSHDGDHDDEDTHDQHHGLAPGQKPHETPWVVTLPLVCWRFRR